jgi:hypothetical protein
MVLNIDRKSRLNFRELTAGMSGFEKASAFQNPSFVIWGAIFHLPFGVAH